MLPANNRGTGANICAPDVCATPPVGVPTPYVNIAMNALAVPFATKTYLNFVNALNMGSTVPMTMGDQPGVMSPFMGPGTYTVGNPKIIVEMLPGTNLTSGAAGNNMIAPAGASLVPCVTNVFYTYRAAGGEPAEERFDIEELGDRVRGRRGLTLTAHGLLLEAKIALLTLDVPSRLHAFVATAEDKEIILDLRGCPGGELLAAAELASDFLPFGAELFALVDADGDEVVYRARRQEPNLTSPLTLVVDRETASAAEIFAGVLKAHGRARITGEETFGKRSVHSVTCRASGETRYECVGEVRLPLGASLPVAPG